MAALGTLILAVRFLTIVPVPGREAVGAGALGRAAWWFPVVGLGLGAALAALDRALALVFPPLLASLLVVSAWKVATGGIHLDGLADCLDGLGGASAEHSLRIMRDGRIGVFGAVGLILAFLVAVVALAELPAGPRGPVLLLAPVLGRVAPLLVARVFRAASPGQGLAGPFVGAVSPWALVVHAVAAAVLALALVGGWGAGLVLASGVVAHAWSSVFARRLGGVTGDVLGGAVELAELTALLAAAALAHVGALAP